MEITIVDKADYDKYMLELDELIIKKAYKHITSDELQRLILLTSAVCHYEDTFTEEELNKMGFSSFRLSDKQI